MKQIKPDKKVEQAEQQREAIKKAEREARQQAMEAFRVSPAYKYVMQYFTEYEKQIIDEIGQQQERDLKTVFMLPLNEQRATIARMSKRNVILTGVLSILKRVKGKL